MLEWNEGGGSGTETRGVGTACSSCAGRFLGALGEKVSSHRNGLKYPQLQTYQPGMGSEGETRKCCFTILTRAFETDGSMLCASNMGSADDSNDSGS